MKTTLDTPPECPLCASKIRVLQERRVFPTLIVVFIIGFFVSVAFDLAGLPYVGIGIAVLVCTVAQHWSRYRDYECEKCHWKESFLMKKNPPNDK